MCGLCNNEIFSRTRNAQTPVIRSLMMTVKGFVSLLGLTLKTQGLGQLQRGGGYLGGQAPRYLTTCVKA